MKHDFLISAALFPKIVRIVIEFGLDRQFKKWD